MMTRVGAVKPSGLATAERLESCVWSSVHRCGQGVATSVPLRVVWRDARVRTPAGSNEHAASRANARRRCVSGRRWDSREGTLQRARYGGYPTAVGRFWTVGPPATVPRSARRAPGGEPVRTVETVRRRSTRVSSRLRSEGFGRWARRRPYATRSRVGDDVAPGGGPVKTWLGERGRVGSEPQMAHRARRGANLHPAVPACGAAQLDAHSAPSVWAARWENCNVARPCGSADNVQFSFTEPRQV